MGDDRVGDDPFDGESHDRSQPPGFEALQAAAREAIDATRALLDVAEALVDDPDVAERMGSIVRSVTSAAARAARGAGGHDRPSERGDDDPDDDDGGVEHISID